MGKNNKQRRKQKKNRMKSKAGQKEHELNQRTKNFEIEPRVSVVGIPVVMDEHGIRVATDTQYAVQDHTDTLLIERTIPQSLINKFRAISGPYNFAGKVKDDKRHIEAQESWPHQWTYLSAKQVFALEELGLINTRLLMLDVVSNLPFGVYIYTTTHIQRFLDTYTEIAWIDYAIRYYLKNYTNLYDPMYVTLGIDFEFNPKVAVCWLTLENCIIRIAGMWDRLVEYLLPLYFFGKSYEEIKPSLNKRNKKAELAKRIGELPTLNVNQKPYLDLMLKAALDYDKSDFRNLRNRVVHEFVYRPEGIVPTGSDTIPTPTNIEELHSQVLEQLSKVRETIIIFTAMMLQKSPTNQITQVEA